MKISTLITIPFLALSLTGCIFDSSKSNDKSDKAPEKNILATESDYIPKDGDQVTSSFSYTFKEDDRIVHSGEYDQMATFNIVNELPQKYGYQHPEAGPYLKASSYRKRPNMAAEATELEYYSAAPNYDLLIDHDLNDYYYSTIEFTDSTNTSSDSNDGLIVEGEIVTATKNAKLFDEITGNEIGYSTLSVTLTALNSEEITIRAGTFTAARAEYRAEQSTIINGRPKDSSTQSLSGYYWFDSKTNSTLKYSIEGTYTAHNDLERILKSTASSELISSSEYENTMTAQNSLKHSNSFNLLKTRSIRSSEVLEHSYALTKKLAHKISASNFSKF